VGIAEIPGEPDRDLTLHPGLAHGVRGQNPAVPHAHVREQDAEIRFADPKAILQTA